MLSPRVRVRLSVLKTPAGGPQVQAGPQQDGSMVQPGHQAEADQSHLGHPHELQLGGGREVQGGEDDGGGVTVSGQCDCVYSRQNWGNFHKNISAYHI